MNNYALDQQAEALFEGESVGGTRELLDSAAAMP
jgi:hypothetical protein